MITGKDLIGWGFRPGKWFPQAIAAANELAAEGADEATMRAAVATFAPPEPLDLSVSGETPLSVNIEAENEAEAANVAACLETMTEMLRTPVVKAGAIMPDACPAGSMGTIPVGGIAASEAIHPGMHSADICCSMALTVIGDMDPKQVLDALQSVTHFGPGGREEERQCAVPNDILVAFENNRMLKERMDLAQSNFATQGDGNHFAYVGQMKSTGETTIVTHHGSRGPGAALYKAGMRVADTYRKKLSPNTKKGNAWIPADTADGDTYWEALQIIRSWTKANHFAIHDMTLGILGAKAKDRFWNEHNFVFRKPDGLFYHAKGATPAFNDWADDATDLTIIPLNMSEPILIVRGKNADHGLGFSPHGAGRNFSRTAHKKSLEHRPVEDVIAEETTGIDARFYLEIHDLSELPSAYKDAPSVRAQIESFGLAEIVDEVIPYGCIMAGDWLTPFLERKRKRAAESNSKSA